MNEPNYVFIGAGLGLFVLGALVCMAMVAFGYWMGRNSAEQPIRSIHNPKKTDVTEYVAPIDEPEGDLFNDAAHGDENHTRGISTMTGQ